MARKVTGGLTGSPSVGALNVAPTAVVTAADNQNITLSPQGTGSVVITNNAILNAQSDLRFGDADSSNWVAFQGPATVGSNVTWTLPETDGTLDQVLTTNASGTLSWTSKSVVISDQTVSASTFYPLFTTSTSGAATGVSVSTSKMTYQPSTGTLGATVLSSTGNTTVGGNLQVTGTVSASFPVYLNTPTISASYTIPSGINAMSAGPITIAAGQTVTVNGDWSIV